MTDRLPFDRWLEMDLTWFDPARDMQPQIDELLNRVAPLLTSVDGERGIFFNVGWLIDLVTEWTGRPEQFIPTRSRRTAKWAGQTYADLGGFISLLRERAAHCDLADLKVGVLFVGWGHVVWPPELKIYDFDSDWYDRHPELYAPPMNFIGMPVLIPGNRLKADDHAYATAPDGLEEGTYFPDFFGAQWGDLSQFLGLDAIHLRDGLTGPMVYTRNGPFGASAPADPEAVRAFNRSVCDLFRQTKRGNPEALVVGYSSAISPVADWRVGCVDFESLVAEGFIDGWVEQTWGGAWQDWWHQLWKGWTFQLGNLLTRGALIARANEQRDTPCKFYNLIETWDGWEPWDTLHQVPEKLRWAMWAFSHAGVLTPQGVKPPDGSYISWMNNGQMDLLSEADIAFIGNNLDAAQASAAAIEEIFGPTLVYNRPMMAWLSDNHPDWNASEWIDDQAAMLLKWGVPVLAITRTEWLSEVRPSSLIVQTPGQLDDEVWQTLESSIGPVLASGRADLLDDGIRQMLGIEASGELQEPEFYVCHGDAEQTPPYDRPYLPPHQPVEVVDSVAVHYRTRQTPLLASRGNWIYWQPPDWSEPFNQFVPKYQMGSSFPHYRTAALLHEFARRAGLSHVAGVEWAAPFTLSLWRSSGTIMLLLGNLETGYFGDSRTAREAVCWLSLKQLGLTGGSYQMEDVSQPNQIGGEVISPDEIDAEWITFSLRLKPESSRILKVIEKP